MVASQQQAQIPILIKTDFGILFLNLHVVRERLTTWALRLLHGNGHSSQTPKLQDAINHWQSFSSTLWCSSTHQRLTSWRQLQREIKSTKPQNTQGTMFTDISKCVNRPHKAKSSKIHWNISTHKLTPET